jgi:hypothetical protein
MLTRRLPARSMKYPSSQSTSNIYGLAKCVSERVLSFGFPRPPSLSFLYPEGTGWPTQMKRQVSVQAGG